MYLILEFHENVIIENLDVIMRIENIGAIKKFYNPLKPRNYKTLKEEGFVISKRIKKNNILNSPMILIIDLEYKNIQNELVGIIRNYKLSCLLE